MITGNGYSLKRFPRLLLLFWIRFLTAFKREKKNYGVSPPWLSGNNPLLLFCASFFSKASKFSFLKIFNSPFEDTLKRAASATLISYQGLRPSFPSPLTINLLLGLVDRVWKAHPRAGKTWKFRGALRAPERHGAGWGVGGKFASRRVPQVLLSGRGNKQYRHLSLSREWWRAELVVSVGKDRSIAVGFLWFFFLLFVFYPILRTLGLLWYMVWWPRRYSTSTYLEEGR